MGEKASGNATRVFNFLKSYDKRVIEMKEELKKAKQRKADIEMILSKTGSVSARIKALENELDVINARIGIDDQTGYAD